MASIDKYLRDPEYNNWVKSGLALNFTTEVLTPFVVKEITKLHHSIVKKLPSGVSCTGCSVNTRCPNGICDEIQREIENNHWYPYPSFRNTCTGRWSKEPWEIAKCYMPPLKGCKVISIKDADFTDSISVIINCKHLQAFGTSDPHITETVYTKSRDFRNRVMHASPQKVTENDMRENLDILINILKMIKTPENEDDKKEAIEKIEKIKLNQLTIKLEDLIEVRRTATEAVADEREKDEDQVQRERLLVNFETGCRKALCRLTEEHISKQEENLSVADFLSKIRILALVNNLCSKHHEMLFPEYDTHADIREWDLFVYCFILEEIELTKPLEDAVSKFVQEVKKIRNSLLIDATGVTQNDLSELCKYLFDTDLSTEITEIFNRDTPDDDVIRSNNILVSWWRQEEDSGKRKVSKEQLNNNIQLMKTIEKCVAESEKKIFQRIMERLGYEGEQVPFQEAHVAVKTGAECEVRARGCDEKTGKALQEHTTNSKYKDTEKTKSLNNFCQKLNLKDVNVKKGSIILNVTCSSINNVINFWDSCFDGRAVEALSDLRDYYRRYFKCDTLEFDVILTKKGVSKSVDEIVEGLPSLFEVLVDNVTNKVQEILKAKGSSRFATKKRLFASQTTLAPLEPMRGERRSGAHLSGSSPSATKKRRLHTTLAPLEPMPRARLSRADFSGSQQLTSLPLSSMTAGAMSPLGGSKTMLTERRSSADFSEKPPFPFSPTSQLPMTSQAMSPMLQMLAERCSRADFSAMSPMLHLLVGGRSRADFSEKPPFPFSPTSQLPMTSQAMSPLGGSKTMLTERRSSADFSEKPPFPFSPTSQLPMTSQGDSVRDIEKHTREEVDRLVKDLRQISEGGSIALIQQHLGDIIRYSKEDNEKMIDECNRKFLKQILKSGQAPNLISQAMRVFRMIRHDPSLGDLVQSEIDLIEKEQRAQADVNPPVRKARRSDQFDEKSTVLIEDQLDQKYQDRPSSSSSTGDPMIHFKSSGKLSEKDLISKPEMRVRATSKYGHEYDKKAEDLSRANLKHQSCILNQKGSPWIRKQNNL